MIKPHWRTAVVIWWVISLAVGFVGCREQSALLTEPMPISKANAPWTFKVVGFKNGKALLLTHEVGLQLYRRKYNNDKDFREAVQQFEPNILWNDVSKSGSQYSFHIDPKHTTEVGRILTEPIKENFQRVDISILSNNPLTKAQTIRVDYKNNDYYFYSVYAVSNNGVTPLKYGELTKHDCVMAAAIGIEWWLLAFVPGMVIYGAINCINHKRLQRGQSS